MSSSPTSNMQRKEAENTDEKQNEPSLNTEVPTATVDAFTSQTENQSAVPNEEGKAFSRDDLVPKDESLTSGNFPVGKGSIAPPPLLKSSKGPLTNILKDANKMRKKDKEEEEAYAEDENAEESESDEESGVDSEFSSDMEGSEDEDYEDPRSKKRASHPLAYQQPYFVPSYQQYPNAMHQQPGKYPAGLQYPPQYFQQMPPAQPPMQMMMGQGATAEQAALYQQQLMYQQSAGMMQKPTYFSYPHLQQPNRNVPVPPQLQRPPPTQYNPQIMMNNNNPAFVPPPQQPSSQEKPVGTEAKPEDKRPDLSPATNETESTTSISSTEPATGTATSENVASPPQQGNVPSPLNPQAIATPSAMQPSPRPPTNPQVLNLLTEISSLPPEEQASVISRLVSQHAQINNVSPQQAEAYRQAIQKAVYERGLQKLQAGVPLVRPSGTPTSMQPSPNVPYPYQQQQQQQFHMNQQHPGMLPMLGPQNVANQQAFIPQPGVQFMQGMPGQPYPQQMVRPPHPYPMQAAYQQMGYAMPQHPYMQRPQLPPMQRQHPSYSQAKSSSSVVIPDETPLKPKRTATKNVKYTFDEEEAEEEEEEEEKEQDISADEESQSAFERPLQSAQSSTDSRKKTTSASKGKKKTSKKEEERITEEDLDAMEVESEGPSIEKILSYRRTSDGRGEEFLVKYKGKSYLHTEWIPRSFFMGEPGGSSRVKRFLSKSLQQHHFSPQHIFNPKFTLVDKVIGEWEGDDGAMFYLVKWCDQPYESVTWESKEDILFKTLSTGPQRLAEFHQRKIPPMQTPFMRPSLHAWSALEESPKYKGGNELRKYQLEGLNWLTFCWLKHQSCIIADEMGLGKTIQTVSFLDLISSKFKAPGPFLVVAPLSTIPHWEREFSGWTSLRVLTYHGSLATREVMYEYEFFYSDAKGNAIPGVFKFDALITTYEMANAGINHLRSIPWKVGIFDEAHRLKNKASKSSEILKSYRIEHKILATGTPIQNSLDELFALLNFMEPNRFFDSQLFHSQYGNLKKSEDVAKLQDLLRPIMLRRLKEDVEKSIPVKEETIIEVELTAVQKRLYRAILEKNLSFLMKGATSGNVSNLMNTMMELRKCCIHPYLIKGSEEAILNECHASTLEEQFNCMVNACGKLVLLDKLLVKLKENGHKVLIFSQMTKCLDLLEDYLKYRRYSHERIDGTIRGDLRQAAIDRFNDPSSDSFVFLLCTRAGGVGINLTSADTVVIFDSDWNPQNDLQAQARCHRIGQTKSVKVYRLITRGTYEREMFDKAGLKLGLDRAVLQHMQHQSPSSASGSPVDQGMMDKKEIEILLKKGAYGLVMENDEDSVKFCEEDIDQILERRTQVIKHDTTSVNSDGQVVSSGPSIFSKASFTATSADDSVDMDDPNFWENWARRLNTDSSTLQQSVSTDEPRLKRHFKRLRAFDNWNLNVVSELNAVEKSEQMVESEQTSEQSSSVNTWSSTERISFLKNILLFGVNSERVFQQTASPRLPIEVYSCIKALVRLCLESVSAEESDTKFKQDIEKTLLGAIAAVTDATGSVKEEVESAESIPDWLSLKTFNKDEIPFPNASKRQCFEFITFLRKAPPALLTWIRSNSYEILLRLLLLEYFRQVCDYYGISKERESQISLPLITGNTPFELEWLRVDDVKMFLIIKESGFCKETFLTSPDVSSARSNDAVSENNDQSKPNEEKDPILDMQVNLFSTPVTLNEVVGRFKKVIISLQKRSQTESRLQMQALKDTGNKRRRQSSYMDDTNIEDVPLVKSRNKMTSLSSSSADWSSIDEENRPTFESFLSVCFYFGLPSIDEGEHPYDKEGPRDWSLFTSKSPSLHSLSSEILEEMAQGLVSFIHGIADTKSRRGRGRPSASSLSVDSSTSLNETYDDEAVISQEDAALPIRYVQAKKLIKIIDTFDSIRLEIEPSIVLVESGEAKARKSQGLPRWWDPPKHDAELLRAVQKHGILPDSIAAISTDDEFSFKADSSSNPQWISQLVIFKRIESISEAVSRYQIKSRSSKRSKPSSRSKYLVDEDWDDSAYGKAQIYSDDVSDYGEDTRVADIQYNDVAIEDAALDDLDDPLVAPSAGQYFDILAHSLPVTFRQFSENGTCEVYFDF